MEIQRLVRRLPVPLQHHKLIRALTTVFPSSRVQAIRYNDGARAFVDFHDGDARTVAIAEGLEPEFFSIARPFLAAGGVFFDVGANYGICSFGLVPSCPGVEYHLFEANPGAVAHPETVRSVGSRHARSADRGGRRRTKWRNLAVQRAGDSTGRAYVGSAGGIRTRLLTLDGYIDGAGVRQVTFTKMDIAGYEIFAMEGARQSAVAGKLPVIYFELKATLAGRFGKTIGDVLAAFRSTGYRLFHIRERDFQALNVVPDLNIQGLHTTELRDYPEDLCTDLLAIHESANQVRIQPR